MRRFGVAVVAICALGAGTATAGIQQTQFPTFFDKFKLEASSSGNEFSGKIDSAKSKCVKDRKVTLYRKKQGDKTKLGSDQTDSKGKFSIGVGSGQLKNGKYFAEVKESSFKNGDGDKITCLDAKSAKVDIS